MPTNSRATRAVERILRQLPADRREQLLQIRGHLNGSRDGPSATSAPAGPAIAAPGYRDAQTPVWYGRTTHPKGRPIVSTAPYGSTAYPAEARLHSEHRCAQCPDVFTSPTKAETHWQIAHDARGRKGRTVWVDGTGQIRPEPPNRLQADLGKFHATPRRASRSGIAKPIVSSHLDPFGRTMIFPGGEAQLRAEAARHNREVQE